MATAERDSTQEWLLPEDSRPPLLSELQARIDEAMATAKSAESAVVSIGAAALDAAEQARLAAELAERASAAMLGAGQAPQREPAPPETPSADDGLADFNERADRLTARLRQLHQTRPVS